MACLLSDRSATATLRPVRRQAAFTLLELLVAVALMAVLAVLCWRGLDSVIRARDVLTASSDETRALTVAFAQMEDDLRRSWGARLYRLPNAVIDFSSSGAEAPIALELLRETGSDDETSRIQKVIYRLRDGQLERGFVSWTRTGARSASASSPAGSAFSAGASAQLNRDDAPQMIWQPLLNNVSGVSIRAWMEPPSGQGAASWYDARALLPPPGGANPPTRIISGIEFALARRQQGRIVRVFSIRD